MTLPKGTMNQDRFDVQRCESVGRHRLDALHARDECPVTQTICPTCQERDGVHIQGCPGLEAEIMAGRDEATRKEYAQIAHETYASTAYQIAENLRDMADRVQHDAVRIPLNPEDGEHVAAAKRAIHELMWGLANANVERLVSDAAEADRAAREANR